LVVVFGAKGTQQGRDLPRWRLFLPWAGAALVCLMHGLAGAGAGAAEPARPADAGESDDAALQFSQPSVDFERFRALIASAVRSDYGVVEGQAREREAAAVRTQTRAALFPRATLSLTSNQPIERSFSGNLDTTVEQSLAQGRTDATLNIDQPVYDFGASIARIRAASERLDAATLDTAGAANATALDAIGAWYDVFANRAAVALAQASVARQDALQQDIMARIATGVLAQGDLARADSYLAGARARVARYRRALAGAETRLALLVAAPPAEQIARGPRQRPAGARPVGERCAKRGRQYARRPRGRCHGGGVTARRARRAGRSAAQSRPVGLGRPLWRA
jgi:outer membrane protein TolC